MRENTLSKKLIFNEKIDSDYLFSLYADDFECIEDIFSTTIKNFDQDAEAIEMAFAGGDIAGLKKAVHKMKPAFGFVGMLTLQQQCKDFEDLCISNPGTDIISPVYKKLITDIKEAKSVLETDYKKLKDYNSGRL